LTGFLENENVEGNIELDVATINVEDEKHVHRSFPKANFGTDGVM
jgi:hypothetical protein